ncbi:Quinone oxidoreductase-like protein [Diplonema papillatum]|nr:Quinone oxidoreductase-like protein [Diplonema papillatum]|eukprot:gene19500-30054_t
MATTRAIIHNYDAPKMVEKKRPKAAPGSGNVVVKVVYAGVNPVDAKKNLGDKLPDCRICNKFVDWFSSASVPGFDMAGTVEEVDPKADTDLKKGDRVYGSAPPYVGTFSEYVCTPLHQVARMPSSVGFKEASALPLAGLTCVQSLQSRVHDGSNVLVIGASGGVGHVASQVCKAYGAKRVVGVCSAESADLVKKHGVDQVVEYHDEDNMYKELLDHAKAHGAFNVVFDTVSSGDARDYKFGYETKIRSHPGLLDGEYLRLGGTPSDWVAAALKRTAGVNLFSKGRELCWVRFPHSTAELQELARLVDMHGVRPEVSAVHPFTEKGVADSFAELLSRRVKGKITLAVCPEDDKPSS